MSLLSAIYGSAVRTRNEFYDRGIFRARRLQGPVVSVGNLSVGGSGKTPFVILLGELLKSRGVKFDVLSRGYGRKTRGVLLVDPGGSAREFGDEPLLMFVAIYLPVIRSEESFLRQKFSNFDEYAQAVPRLLPRLSAYRNQTGSFSRDLYWQHREYNAILGAAAVLAVLAAKLFWASR